MGNTHSSKASTIVSSQENKKSSLADSSYGRGRKTRFSAPHGLAASIVSCEDSERSTPFALDDDDEEQHTEEEAAHLAPVEEDELSTTSEEEEDSDDDFEDDDDDEEWEERLKILEDCKRLKQVAEFLLHPESPVQVDATAKARCFFDRPSAPERRSLEDFEEEEALFKDLAALKEQARAWKHPELPVEVSDVAKARCYFDRASAPEQLSSEDLEAQARIMEDLQQLQMMARHYLHPEVPVETTDPTATARCFF
jgi:hypothetical protein